MAILHYESSTTVPRNWTKANLGFDEINQQLDSLLEKLEPHYKNLANLVKDPRKGSDRIPFPVCLDSTTITCQSSYDFEVQKATSFVKNNKNCIRLMNASMPDGRIITHATSSPSISPRLVSHSRLILCKSIIHK